MTECCEPCDMLYLAREEKKLDHVKHKQRLHPVIGKPLPRFREGDVKKTTRVPDEAAILRVVHGQENVVSRPGLASFGDGCSDGCHYCRLGTWSTGVID